MTAARHHADWLSLVESSGPFLSMPVLTRVFPQGLDPRDAERSSRLREAYEEWRDGRHQPALHHAWVRHVLTAFLGHDATFLAEGQAIPAGIEARIAHHGETLRPDFVLRRPGPDQRPVLLIEFHPPDQDLNKPVPARAWKASPATRMMELLHAANVPVGLVTNGEHWMLVFAPRGETTGFASWYADLWLQEPLTLRAFHSLLHPRRFFGVADGDTLPALLAESSKDQQEVTDQLGLQVRHAVEMLVRALDRLDEESGRQWLQDVHEKDLYNGALTVMMRLVFLFSAEERGLLLLGDPLYDQHYAVSTLSQLLRERADQHGEEVLERRQDAWCRLLSTFRGVHGGIDHEALRLPPYGGTLFDPDRFPFLEGRAPGTTWRATPARPPAINNRVVLHLLESLQLLRVKVPGGGPAEARRLSFRALDIEQIGHVYEGLLDHTARRASEVMLGLVGSKGREPEIPLSLLQKAAQTSPSPSPAAMPGARPSPAAPLSLGARPSTAASPDQPPSPSPTPYPSPTPTLDILADAPANPLPLPPTGAPPSPSAPPGARPSPAAPTGARTSMSATPPPAPPDTLLDLLHEATGRSKSALTKALADRSKVDHGKLRIACGNDDHLVAQVEPFAALLREDTFGRPLVFPQGALFVTSGSDRRSTGTHYTPRSLTEPIVQHTLEPLVYVGPAEGLPKEQWKLKSPRDILALKVCDMAMGSGAFLVQACRYLAERLVEAWDVAGAALRGAGSEERGAGGEPREVGGEGRGAGTQGLKAGVCGEFGGNRALEGENPKLPGTGGLAVGDGDGGGVLSGHEDLSQGRDVRVDEPNTTGGQLGSGEHRGGTRTQLNQGFPEPSRHRARLAARGGDPSVAGPTSGTPQAGPSPTHPGHLPTHQPNALPTPPSPRTPPSLAPTPPPASDPLLASNPPPAPRSSLPASASPPLLVLPDGSVSTGSASEYLLPSDDAERLTLARRYVADRCLYGVDINPMAVEMAKLSLWLITLQRDRPFTFLDHALKCGDSLLGVSRLSQIEVFSLREGSHVVFPAIKKIIGLVQGASDKRRALEELPSNDHTQIQAKNRLHAEAEAATATIKAVADCLIAMELRGLQGAAYEDARETTADHVRQMLEGDGSQEAAGEDRENPLSCQLATHAQVQLRGRRPFHWPVEFPEVFARGGFDAFVGNPPFMGGSKLETRFGADWRGYLVAFIANGLTGVRGGADLCTYFLLRCRTLIAPGGNVGFIATNSIAQGDSQIVGLEQLVKEGYRIIRAKSDEPWPGAATVHYAALWIRAGSWDGESVLNDQEVPFISSMLSAGEVGKGKPHALTANLGRAFEGSKVLGIGFVIMQQEASRLVLLERKNREVLYPYLTGEDLNSQPDLLPTRMVINFKDWDLATAGQYPACLEIVRERVKPGRDAMVGRNSISTKRGKTWWRFAGEAKNLHTALAGMNRCLVLSRITNHLSFAFVPTTWVYSDRLTVFAFSDIGDWAVLQSSFHYAWAWHYSTTNLALLSYSPSQAFLTFPFPCAENRTAKPLRQIANHYYEKRSAIMQQRHEGLTLIYNRFHDRGEGSGDMVRLRELHVEMDRAVALTYGWPIVVNGEVVYPDPPPDPRVTHPAPLDLGHGFHPTKQGERYTISEPARRIVLDRLLALNHQRYQEEVAAGLHDKKRPSSTGLRAPGKKPAAKAPSEGTPPPPQGDLFM